MCRFWLAVVNESTFIGTVEAGKQPKFALKLQTIQQQCHTSHIMRQARFSTPAPRPSGASSTPPPLNNFSLRTPRSFRGAWAWLAYPPATRAWSWDTMLGQNASLSRETLKATLPAGTCSIYFLFVISLFSF